MISLLPLSFAHTSWLCQQDHPLLLHNHSVARSNGKFNFKRLKNSNLASESSFSSPSSRLQFSSFEGFPIRTYSHDFSSRCCLDLSLMQNQCQTGFSISRSRLFPFPMFAAAEKNDGNGVGGVAQTSGHNNPITQQTTKKKTKNPITRKWIRRRGERKKNNFTFWNGFSSHCAIISF